MTSVLRNAFDTNVAVVYFAKKFIRLIVDAAKLMIFSDFFLLTGKLQHNEIFGEHVRFDLRIVLISAGRTVQELLLLIYYGEAVFTDRMAAVKISWCFFL